MASESRDSQDETLSLPADLEAWLEQKAADLGVDRETVLVQLLAAYRAADELDDDRDVLGDPDTVEPAVRSVVADRLPDITETVEEQLDAPTADSLEAHIDEELEQRIDDLEADFLDKLDDVRQRVIQIKRETDQKVTPEQLEDAIERIERLETSLDRIDAIEQQLDQLDDTDERLSAVETELDGVESQVAELRGRLDDGAERQVAELTDRLDDVQDKLQTVAWVVRDLRDDRETGGGTVDAIKQAAAGHDVSRATCQNCGNGVHVGLLTEPSCPHCDATLGGVEPSSRPLGLGSATLTVAAQIESGADAAGDELDGIETGHESDR